MNEVGATPDPRTRVMTTLSPLSPQHMSRTKLQCWLSAEGAHDANLGAAVKAALDLLAFDRSFYELPEELQPYLSRLEQHLNGALQALAEAQAAMDE
jgi:hypothetical protein